MARILGYRFVVRGVGAFPLDMLRYDCCYPTDSESVLNIAICHHEREDYLGARSVTLYRKEREPTAARWESFGWRVVKVEPQKA